MILYSSADAYLVCLSLWMFAAAHQRLTIGSRLYLMQVHASSHRVCSEEKLREYYL